MISLPEGTKYKKKITAKNYIERFVRSNLEISPKNAIVTSEHPFLFEYKNHSYLLTTKTQCECDCDYAIQVQKQPTIEDFNASRVECIKWLKISDHFTPNTIIQNWIGKFSYQEEIPTEGIQGLRAPQIGALHAFMANNQETNESSIIVMPTGTGKTETMLSILIAKRCEKILVVVPSDPLREQISEKFLTLGILPQIGVVSNVVLISATRKS